MSYNLYAVYIWPLIALLIGGLQITAAVLLLREHGSGPWLMLIGGGMTVTGHVAIAVARFGSSFNAYPAIRALGSFATLGSLLFGIGLLLHALRRRALGNRIAELEAILAAHLGG
ncbi:MAG: hypothetical protein V4819_08230 [Verrucomicrobiota bacterium]